LAHSLSAKKRHRQSLKLQQRNRSVKTEARSAVRKARELIAAGSAEEAATAVREASAILDRAASKGVLHRNNATRRKTRLVHGLQKTGTAGAPAAPKARKTAAKTTRSRAKKS
jgi:small subunit ribosomal protein S20